MERAMPDTHSISASDFKATCLEIIKQLGDGTLERVVITRRGKPVAVLTPPVSHADAVRNLHGFMRGSVTLPDDRERMPAAVDDRFDAEDGILHR
jgi:prevent-host-death family protein